MIDAFKRAVERYLDIGPHPNRKLYKRIKRILKGG